MSLKPECPHRDEKMCSCAAIQSEDPLAQITCLFGSIQEPKAELDYTTLASPHPHRFCLSGTCGICGGRLCINLDEPGDLSGDDFLAAVYRHLYQIFGSHLGMNPGDLHRMFAELFHDEDQPAVRCWLEGAGASNGTRAPDVGSGPEGGPCDA